jgi:hypothetical protein
MPARSAGRLFEGPQDGLDDQLGLVLLDEMLALFRDHVSAVGRELGQLLLQFEPDPVQAGVQLGRNVAGTLLVRGAQHDQRQVAERPGDIECGAQRRIPGSVGEPLPIEPDALPVGRGGRRQDRGRALELIRVCAVDQDEAGDLVPAATGVPVERFISIQTRLANGVLLSLTSADMRVDSRRAAVYGDHGMLTGDTTGGGRIYLYRGGDAEEIEPKVGDVSACEAFVSAVTEGAPNLSPARDGAYAVALLEAAYRSAREGRMVRVERPQGW